jgi:hypothetical protein
MRRLIGLISLALFALGMSPHLLAQTEAKGGTDRAHQLAAQAASQHPASCPKPNKLTLQQCHAKFPDGCSQANKPTYDGYLDFLKDQDPGATAASTKNLGQQDFPNLESKIPKTLTDKNHAQLASTLATLGEGNIHTVIAYLYFALDTGALKPPNSETCNCKLATSGTFDYHLGIGFNPKLAASAKTHPKDTDPAHAALEKDSVVAEMTPYIRTSHPKWTFARVNALQGQQIKVVGQLMADNIHFNNRDDCAFSGADPKCWRSTVWEIHPITQFYVCKTNNCTASSPASDWTNLDDMP